MFSLNGTLEKKWVGRAMGNETIYWDGLILLSVNCTSPLNFQIPSPKEGELHKSYKGR